MTAASPPRRGRPFSAAGLAVTGLVLAAGVVVDVVRKAAGEPTVFWDQDVLTAHLAGTRWSQDSVLITAIVLVAVGGLLLVWALLPGRPSRLPLISPDPGLLLGIDRRSARTVLAQAATSVDGVESAQVRLRRRRARVAVRTSLRDPAGLTDGVREAVERRAQHLGLSPLPAVRTRVRTSR